MLLVCFLFRWVSRIMAPRSRLLGVRGSARDRFETRPEKKVVTVGASRCLRCQIQPIPSPDLDPAGTSGRSPRRDVLARDFARNHCVGCGGGDRGGEMLVHG